MPKQTLDLTIDACPICGAAHSYRLDFGTTYLFRGRSANEASKGLRQLGIILECPAKNIPYKAEISVPLEDYLWVAEVKVKHDTR